MVDEKRSSSEEKPEADAPEKGTIKKKAKVPGGPKKSSAYNQYMKRELARLKESDPVMTHKERFKKAAQSWGEASENPKNKD